MPKRPRILILDPIEPPTLPLEAWLADHDCHLSRTVGREAAQDGLMGGAFDIMLAVSPPGGHDPEWLGSIGKLGLGAALILLGGRAISSVRSSVAFDHITEPVTRDKTIKAVELAIKFRAVSGKQHLLRQQLEAVMDGVQAAVILVDEEGVVASANEAAHRLCGFPTLPHGPIGLSGLLPCGGELFRFFQQVAADRKSIRRKALFCEDQGGRKLSIELSATPIWGNAERFAGVVFVIRDRTRLASESRDVGQRSRFHRMIGQSPVMQEIYGLIEDLAGLDTTVLIQGESGVGKELVAEALHYQSRRSRGPLVKVNCSGLPEGLLEAELFGHVRGAFTGAVRDRIGRFKMAEGGTLFLDEIGDISPTMQTRLLRTLQEKEFEPVGDSRTIKVDVRIVAATNQNLHKKIAEGQFREDLYFRLKVVEIHVPPLRERREDIPLLTRHFLDKFNTEYGRNLGGVAESVLELFLKYPWPGNVRELEHVVEHAFAVCHQEIIRVRDLPKEFLKTRQPCADPAQLRRNQALFTHQPSPGGRGDDQDGEANRAGPEGPPCSPDTAGEREGDQGADREQTALDPETLRQQVGHKGEAERAAILQALEHAHWRKTEAAKLLGISRSSLYRKMNVYEIQ